MRKCRCGATTRGQMCAFCWRTVYLVRERLCVSCTKPVEPDDSVFVQGRCFDCRVRQVALCPATRRLLLMAARERHKVRVAA